MTKSKGILPSLKASHKLQARRGPAGMWPTYSTLFTCCPTPDNCGEWIHEFLKRTQFLFGEEGRKKQKMIKILITYGYHSRFGKKDNQKVPK